MGKRSRLFETWAGLAAPRRSIPILTVGLPLVAAQYLYGGTVEALLIGVVLFMGFVLLGPAGWRVLGSQGAPGGARLPGVAAFVLLGVAVIGLGGVALPRLMGLHITFFTDLPSLAILLAFFWVGGWGLGRDIDLELSLAAERRRADVLTRERERAELLAVRSHLDPHFLFNALNAIAEWCQEDPAVAEAALLRLATMLRTVLSGVQATAWPLSRELELVDHVLAIHEVRDPTRFSVEREGWALAGDAQVPPLLLLPIIENALKHGPAAGFRGLVRVSVAREGARVVVEIENPGPFTGLRDGGHGVAMVQRRLALEDDAGAGLVLAQVATEPPRTRATVRLPAG